MKKIIVFLSCFLLQLAVNGQNNGYMGKRFHLDYKVSTFPILKNVFGDDDIAIKLTPRHNFSGGYAIGRHLLLGVNYASSTIPVNHTLPLVTLDGGNFLSDESMNFDYKYEAYGLSVSYFLHDFIAPLGSSIRLSVGKAEYELANKEPIKSVSFLPYYDAAANANLVVKEYDLSEPIKLPYVGLGFYNSKVLAGPFYWISGVELTALLNSKDKVVNLYPVSKNENLSRLAEEARREIVLHQIVTLKFGIGIFL